LIRGEARAVALGVLLLAVLALVVAVRLEVTTDITYFLPAGAPDADVTLARQLTASELSRTMVLLVDARDTDEAVAASRELEQALRDEPRVASALAFLDGGPPDQLEDALWQLYEPRRFSFLASDPADVPERLSPEALRAAAVHLKRRLALPISGPLSRVAPGDPLLILPDLFQRVAGTRADGLTLAGGRFVTADGRGAVLFLGTTAAPFDSRVQRPLLDGVSAAFDGVNARHGGGLHLAWSGANRFSVRAEDVIQADIGRVSLWSVAGIVALFMVLFRSLRLVLLTLPIMLAGSLAGTAACLVLFGSVHGLTLAFGAALIGVSVDYAAHFYCHHVLAPDPGGPRRTLARIWPALVLGSATTVVGFITLLGSSFPGLREFAVFGAFGIGVSLLATRMFLPGLVQRATPPTRACRAVVYAIEAAAGAPRRRRAVLLVLVAGVLVLAALGLPRARWNDDIADLNRLDPELMREDAAIRDRVGRYEQRRFVVAVGPDEEQALQVNDRVSTALAEAEAAGEIGGFRSAAALVPSAARQRAVDAAVRSDATVASRVQEVLAAEGFQPEAFEPFREALAAPAPRPLAWDDVLGSPLGPLVRPFRVTLDRDVGVLSFLLDVRDEPALQQRLSAVPGARLVDIKAILTEACRAYRARMVSLLLLGMVAVVGLVALRHRAARPTVVACLPALLAALGTVAVLGLAGVALNLLTLVTLLMIVSMGDDFGIFLAETSGDRAALDATHLAVLLSAASTVLSFGLLALSGDPALHSIGLTASVGVCLCLFFAPLVGSALRAVGPPGADRRNADAP
jgi:predicted exporter